jgi:hypothetical protein
MPVTGRTGGPAPAADEPPGLPTGSAPWAFESVSRGFNSGSTEVRDCDSTAAPDGR